MRPRRLIVFVCVWVTLGCDSILGRWDRVHVEVSDPENAVTLSQDDGSSDASNGGTSTDGTTGEPSTPADTTAPVVGAGADVLTNALFSRTATAADGSAMTYLWDKTAGGGTVTFSAATGLTTDISAASSGVYTIRLTVTDAAGNATSDTFTLNWDATPPSPPTTQTLAADAAGGPDVTIDDDANVFLTWSGASDGAGAGIRDYTVEVYSQAACAGVPVEVTGVVGPSHTAAAADGQTLSFQVKAVDKLGQESALSACKTGIKVDLTNPVALQAFSVASGEGLAAARIGTNQVTMNFPDDAGELADYKTVVIRRLKDGVPASDCSDGKIAKTYTAPTFPDPDTFLDFTNDAGASFGYRVCITDAAGRTRTTDVEAAKVAKPQILFATTLGYTGDLTGAPAGGPATGLGRADFICDQTAAASSTSAIANEPNWKAVMSDTTTSAKNRLGVFGVVKNFSLARTLALGYSGFWSDPLLTFVEDDVGGFPQLFALTGTRRNGLHGSGTQNCGQWSNGAGTTWVGDTNGMVPWLNTNEGATVSCSDAPDHYSLYCTSQPDDAPAIPTMTLTTASGADLGIDVRITLPGDIFRYATIDLFRQGGGTAPSAECDSGYVDTVVPTTAGTQLLYNDAGAAPGATFSYRACAFDAVGNIISTKTALSGVSR